MTNEVLQKTTSNEQNVSSSNGLEPHLRFGDFTGSWKKSILSSLFKKCLEKNKNGLINNVICNSAKNGLMPQRDFFDKDIANAENTNGYYIIQENDFVYNPRKSNEAPYGPISIYKYKEKGIVSPLYLCFRATQEINPRYFEMYFKSSVWHKYIYFAGDSGARHDRVSIKDDVFFEMPIKLPSLSEQQKIADFLSLVDQRIEKQRQLVESLKKYKRGAISRIFSKHSSWNKDTADELAHITTGSSNTQDSVADGKYPFFIRSANVAHSNKYIFDGEAVLTIGDGQIGKVFHYINGKFDCHQRVYMITNFRKISGRYFYHFFSTFFYERAMKMSAKNTVDSVRMEMIAKMPIYYPSQEQQNKIGSFLDALDGKIVNEHLKQEKLELIKKGLLQQMFI